MKNIAHQTQRSVVLHRIGRYSQPLWCPDEHIVDQAAQEHNHLLRFKPLFASLAEGTPLLVAFERGFDPTSTLIVETQVGKQQILDRIKTVDKQTIAQFFNLIGQQAGSQDSDAPLPIRFALTD